MPEAHASVLAGSTRLPFPEQIAFFRRKLGNLVPTRVWTDLLREQHDTAFMVAGAAKADLLTDLAAAVDAAIAEGQGIEAFAKNFRAITARHGWTDYTGSDTKKGRAWRVATIYRTNMMTSYAAGRLAQLKAGNFRYWIYFHGGSREPRPQHLGWNGMALPPDHPFWDKFYPPSDWGCSCYVIGADTEAGIRRRGGDPGKTLPPGWDRIDPRTGAPFGIGKGWDYAPGASVAGEVRALAAKIRNWAYRIAKAFMEELKPEAADAMAEAYRALPSTADDLRRFAQRVYRPLPESDTGPLPAPLPLMRTIGLLRSDQAKAIREASGVDVDLFDFSITRDEIKHIIRRHGDDAAEARHGQRAITPDDYPLLSELLTLAEPESDGLTDAGKPAIKFTAMIGGKRHQAVFEVRTGNRTLSLLSFRIWR